MRIWIDALVFDEWNEDECARHHVSAREVREVLDERPVYVPNKRPHAAGILMIGPTIGGRFLTIPLAEQDIPGLWRPATAWDSSDAERARYRAIRRRPD